MNFLGTNLKFLRKSRNMTQEELANKLGVKRSLIGAYEEGRVEPRLRTLSGACHYFHLTLDALINTDLSREQQEDKHTDIKGQQLRILPVITDNNSQKELCTLVPVKASAGYLKGYGDIDYIENLPKFSLPYTELSGDRTYRVFQISGDSMLPVLPGTYIICEYVLDWHRIKNEECYVVITRDEGIVYKRIINNLSDGELLLKSDNPEYAPYRVKADQIIEVWKARGFTSFNLPSGELPQPDMTGLMNTILQLQQDVQQLKTKLL
jgi:transcriptional regulator with XRE-family HTH domain